MPPVTYFLQLGSTSLLEFLEFTKIVPPAGDQMFKPWGCGRNFVFKQLEEPHGSVKTVLSVKVLYIATPELTAST